MDFQKFENDFSQGDNMKMHQVADIIINTYSGESLTEFLKDMKDICKGDFEKRYKAVAAFGYYYIASKFDTLLIPMVKKSWDDMLKYYN